MGVQAKHLHLADRLRALMTEYRTLGTDPTSGTLRTNRGATRPLHEAHPAQPASPGAPVCRRVLLRDDVAGPNLRVVYGVAGDPCRDPRYFCPGRLVFALGAAVRIPRAPDRLENDSD